MEQQKLLFTIAENENDIATLEYGFIASYKTKYIHSLPFRTALLSKESQFYKHSVQDIFDFMMVLNEYHLVETMIQNFNLFPGWDYAVGYSLKILESGRELGYQLTM